MRKLIALAACLCIGLISLQAQDRYGHLNLGNLISLMPEAAEADQKLEAYQDSLVTAGEAIANQFQQDYVAYITAVQEGTLTPVEQQEQVLVLDQRQQQLATLEQQILQAVQVRRNVLLEPIVNTAMAAIDEVAKENGFKLVFDTSIFNTVMYAAESEDLMPLVMAKLGIEEEGE